MRATSALQAIILVAVGICIAQMWQLPPGKRSVPGDVQRVGGNPEYQIRTASSGQQRANATVEVFCNRQAPGAIPGRSCSPIVHRHEQAEYLETKQGSFGFNVDGKDTAVLVPGDLPITVPAGTPHYFWNTNPNDTGVLLAAFEATGNVELFFGEAMEIKTYATV